MSTNNGKIDPKFQEAFERLKDRCHYYKKVNGYSMCDLNDKKAVEILQELINNYSKLERDLLVHKEALKIIYQTYKLDIHLRKDWYCVDSPFNVCKEDCCECFIRNLLNEALQNIEERENIDE